MLMTTDLLIPARDEADNIEALREALDPLRKDGTLRRVVLIDNGSTDGTAGLAREAGFETVRESQRGYGAACLAGLSELAADPPDVVAFLDADLADDPAMLPDMIRSIAEGRADLVLGQRRAKAEAGALDPHQRFGNWLACTLLRAVTGQAFSDLGPLRVVRWRSLEMLFMADRTWGWTIEMQYKAARAGLRIEEVDVPYRRRRAGRSKISGSIVGSARAGVKIVATLAHLWWATPKWRSSGEALRDA